jgi:hypothetical protein
MFPDQFPELEHVYLFAHDCGKVAKLGATQVAYSTPFFPLRTLSYAVGAEYA